ncbi:hypothetical protein BANRA_01924 [Klebsiella pneumoniae]|nr:hypothetical protein BANRA_01924 [Klebsiella pneumoniae]
MLSTWIIRLLMMEMPVLSALGHYGGKAIQAGEAMLKEWNNHY